MPTPRPFSDAALPAALAALGLGAFAWIDRLPAAADYVVPRHPGWGLFSLGLAAARGPAGRVLTGAAFLLLAAALFFLARGFWRALGTPEERRRLWSARGLLASAAGVVVLAGAARLASAVWFDLLFNSWFAPGSADLREPILSGLGALWVVFWLGAALSFLGRSLAGEGKAALARCAGCAAVFLAPALVLYVWAAAVCDARAASLSQAAGIPRDPSGRESLLVLTTGRGGTGFEVYDVPVGMPGAADLSGESLQALEGYLARRPRSVYRQQAERLLWEGYSRSQDVGRLRQSLLASARGGDALAWLVLADHLSSAPPDALAAGLLDELCDERRWRIGGRAALLLAAAYAHLGRPEQAGEWRRRGAAALDMPPELAPGLPQGGALRPGEVRGTLRGPRGARAALYARQGPQEPYALSPNRLVASTACDGRGRFRFGGLSAGDYYLVFAFPPGALPARHQAMVVRGHRGDIRLSARQPAARVELDISGGRAP
jgi:hypothetical protein